MVMWDCIIVDIEIGWKVISGNVHYYLKGSDIY